MITERLTRDDGALYQTECACAYPSCTITVGRVRLLYGILHATGMDTTREIQRGR
jgi:hypothetical protein